MVTRLDSSELQALMAAINAGSDDDSRKKDDAKKADAQKADKQADKNADAKKDDLSTQGPVAQGAIPQRDAGDSVTVPLPERSTVRALDGALTRRTGGRTGGVVPYDLMADQGHRGLERLLPILQAANESLATRLAADLGQRVGRNLVVTATNVWVMNFSKAAGMSSVPTAQIVLRVGHPGGRVLCILDRALARGLVYAALGDRSASASPGARTTQASDLSRIEVVVLGRLLDALVRSFAGCFSMAWPEGTPAEKVHAGSDIQLIAAPGDATAMLELVVSGGASGRIRFLLPQAVLDPVRSILMTRGPGTQPPGTSEMMARALEQSDVEVQAELGRIRISLSALMGLRPGDVLQFARTEKEPVAVFVAGRPKMTAWWRKVNGRNSIEIISGMREQKPASQSGSAWGHLAPLPRPTGGGSQVS